MRSDEIRIKRGVRQGCVLSPCLFNLYTDTIFRLIEDSKGVTIGGTQINNLRYADDTFMLTDSEEDLQNLVDKENKAGKFYNMKMNAKNKTGNGYQQNWEHNKSQHQSWRNSSRTSRKLQLSGSNSEWWWWCVHDIKKRSALAKITFSKMKDVLKSTKIPLNTRKRIL